ncbi:MAG: leucine-rich repeat domain-containing protein [Treponema sp.]|jgi:hypothetical protein|nr:leucine-rich repeat domain-containing protein [Treponema sp.]
MKKNRLTLIAAASLIMFALILGACPPIDEEESENGNSIDNPAMKKVEVALGNDKWTEVLEEIKEKNQYVILDLSACTAPASNTGGGLTPDNKFNPISDSETGKDKIVRVILPDAAVEINGDFHYFKNLKSISGKNIRTIIKNIFSNCSNLVSVEFPLLEGIPEEAFFMCTSLVTVEFYEMKGQIFKEAFMGCTSLEYARIPNASKIEEKAFSGCTSLKSVHFSNATDVGTRAFSDCTSLKSATFTNAASFQSTDKVFGGCTSLESVFITTAAGSAFKLGDNIFERTGSKKLTITLGEGPDAGTVGTRMFDNATGKTVVVKIKKGTWLSATATAAKMKDAFGGKGSIWLTAIANFDAGVGTASGAGAVTPITGITIQEY